MKQEIDKYANMSEAEIKKELELKFGKLYDELYAAGFCRAYPPPSGRQDFAKNCMTIVDNEIEKAKTDKSLLAIADSRELAKYEKPALREG